MYVRVPEFHSGFMLEQQLVNYGSLGITREIWGQSPSSGSEDFFGYS